MTPTPDSLERLLGRLNAGDAEALERLLDAYEPYLRLAVRRRLGARLRAKVESRDIVQSALADVVAGFRRGGLHFDGRAQWLAYLKQIAARRLADHHRKHRRGLEHERPLGDTSAEAPAAVGEPRPSEVAQGREFWERLVHACPPAHREVLRLRRLGTPLAEIAARTGLHPGSVRRILYDLARRLDVPPRGGAGPADVG